MNLLLDTHVLLWHTANDARLNLVARAKINVPSNEVFVSILSCWEIAIKHGLGKIELAMSIEDLLDLTAHGISQLAVSSSDVQAYSRLGFPWKDHRDPFDRMIAIQTKAMDATLFTADQSFSAYLPASQIAFV